ncbi:hypothetical protein E2C01_019957 [Portunus trituberculatus]|uniref:Uncharacterized protein n=1 Tax=Portunus trituberculatus TaxID=210409 RepID=A0A5B7DZA7_PORTR|nr:hypothetical protein [Portunus trituberculatus]
MTSLAVSHALQHLSDVRCQQMEGKVELGVKGRSKILKRNYNQATRPSAAATVASQQPAPGSV